MLSLGAVARRNPSGTAVIEATSSLTFAKLFDKSEALASAMNLDRDVDTPVAFVAHNTSTSIALYFALLERKIPALPLNPRSTETECRSLVERVGARWVDPTEPGRDVVLPPTRDRGVPSATSRKPQLLISTSGSTGTPKLVCLSHAALEAAAAAAIVHLAMTAGDRWLLSLNLSHVGGVAILLRCLMCEATVALAEPGMPPESMVSRIAHARATLASLVPTQLDRLLGAEVPSRSVESLRAVLLGGAHAPRRLVQRARAAGWPVLPTYGLSEAGSQICTQPLTDLNVETVADDAGIPLPGVELKIESGVICVRGAALFDGYLAESASPFDADGWFHTSDLGTMTDQGRLVPLGRRDDCIVTGGEKVSALEIESTLMELPWIRSAAVVALADASWGQVVAAAVVLEQSTDMAATLARIEAALAARLAPHKRPRRWLVLEALPLLRSGKLDRPAVRALFLPDKHPTDVEAVGFCTGSG